MKKTLTSPTASSMSEMPYFLYAINNDPHFRVALGVHEVGPTNPVGTRTVPGHYQDCTRYICIGPIIHTPGCVS